MFAKIFTFSFQFFAEIPFKGIFKSFLQNKFNLKLKFAAMKLNLNFKNA